MKRVVLFSLLSLGLIVASTAQNEVKKKNQPQENSKVTREYDEKGNLIKFDSVYSYSYSNDTTLMNNFSPKDFSGFFDRDFGFSNDSTFKGKSLFDHFDKMFADPFSHFDANEDSILMKHFNQMHQFHQLNKNDSSTFSFGNFGDMFDHLFENEKDSTRVKKQGKIAQRAQPKSMDEMMQMFQQQIQEMEKRQKQFFEDSKKFRQF